MSCSKVGRLAALTGSWHCSHRNELPGGGGWCGADNVGVLHDSSCVRGWWSFVNAVGIGVGGCVFDGMGGSSEWGGGSPGKRRYC